MKVNVKHRGTIKVRPDALFGNYTLRHTRTTFPAQKLLRGVRSKDLLTMNALIVVVIIALAKCMVESLSVPSATCVDKVACDRYSPAICTDPQYFIWTKENCPAYCGKCSQESHQGFGKMLDSSAPECKDTDPNCVLYGTELCGDVKFYNWANENCQKHCNRCSNECKDAIENCAEYGSDVCSNLSYYNWVQMNCRKFCARCQA